MEKLDKKYRKDKMMENYIKVRSYLKVERKEEEKIEDYLQKYERLAEECKKAAGSMLVGEIKGCHLLEQANLDEQQKQMVLSACGKDKLEYEMVAKVMKRIFEGIGEEKDKDEWWESGGRSLGNKSNRMERRNQENRKKKPIGKSGRITRCTICDSEYHWARECKKNYVNNRDWRGKQGEEDTKEREGGEEKVYMGDTGEEEEMDDWALIEAILDQSGKQVEEEIKGGEVKRDRGAERVYMGGTREEDNWKEFEEEKDVGWSGTGCGKM
jgi:hypothetical protein